MIVHGVCHTSLHCLPNFTQVDIFTLGSCLYELMSLRGLPPIEINEAEYKHMLQTGNRAQFYAKVYTMANFVSGTATEPTYS